MFTTNPFAQLSAFISPGVVQVYILAMIVLVVAGTLFDVIHKKSARYFIDNWRNEANKGPKQVGSGQIASMAVRTLLVEVMMSAEFCNARRRIAHLLTMYGFLVYLIATIVMTFIYPTNATPAPEFWTFLWHLGALSVCVGGYWFWFFIRVDVAAEGNSPFRLIRADLFVLSLLASVTLGLLWSWSQGSVFGWVCFAFYVLSTTVLFAGVPWSKFAHMFFKPAAALQKRVAEADGSMENLPPPADEPEQYGLGIKRALPRNY